MLRLDVGRPAEKLRCKATRRCDDLGMKSQKTPPIPSVQAANALTARWCSRLGREDYAVSGAGLWPLLALLASAADEPAAAELAAALGRPAGAAKREALEIIDLLRAGVSTTASLGIWTRKGVPLDADWASLLREDVVGTLTDQVTLDRWVDEQTGGLIDKFPIDITDETLLVLASALTARVRWSTPFEGYPRGGGKMWSDDPIPADQQLLSRNTSDLSIAAVLDGMVTRVVVEGDGDVDVHLLLGDQPPADVLGVGLRELSGEAQVRLAEDAGDSGPGLTVSRLQSSRPEDMLELSLPSFEIKTHHDLLAYPELFGLGLLTDTSTSHLPRLSPVPLAISNGAQDVLARFFAEGFEAAAVTAFGAVAGSAPPKDRYEVTFVEVDFDRPFGFLAVHRPTRLAVVAGWVNSPFQSD